jgi:hypothetical protein
LRTFRHLTRARFTAIFGGGVISLVGDLPAVISTLKSA